MPNHTFLNRPTGIFWITVIFVSGVLGFWVGQHWLEPSPWHIEADDVEWEDGTWRSSIPLHQVIRELPEDDEAALRHFRTTAGLHFARVYVEDILAIGSIDSAGTARELKRFAQHESIAPTLHAVDSTSGEPTKLETAEAFIERAFRRFHHHFPSVEIPQLIWMHSGFNSAVWPDDEVLAVGLEWFLGSEHAIVQSMAPSAFPGYLRDRMSEERMNPEAIRGWLLVHFSQRWYQPETCADALLFWGKVNFVLDQILPDTPDALWMDWNESEWEWAKSHERAIWVELSQQNVLFDTNPMEFMRWFNEGPFTRAAAIPQESPDRLGSFMGWRMVVDYMTEHPETSLSELMSMTDPMPFLKTYRPQSLP